MALRRRITPRAQSTAAVVGVLVVGAVGAVLMACFGTVVGALPDGAKELWWFHLSTSHRPALVGFYLGAGLLVAGWAGLGVLVRRGGVTLRACWAALVAWGTPLILGPPLFSRDLYSYVAQGLVAKAGHNPYTTSPSVLVGNPVVLGIASVWRHTPAPYGPLAVFLTEGSVRVAGHSLPAEIMVMRLPEVFGLAILLVAVPRLARALGADPVLAVWLGVLSPLALVSFLAAGHNEGLMLAFVVLAALCFVTERIALGAALGAAAATIKLPALGVVGFPVASQLGRREEGASRRSVLALGVVLVTFAVLSLLTFDGLGWLSPSALQIPTELRTLITPSVALGVFVASLLHAVGITVATHAVVSVTRTLVGLATLAVLVALLWSARRYEWVRLLGLALLVLAFGSPTLWPWYVTWGLCILAATPAQRSNALALLACVPVFLVDAQGTPALTGHSYLVVVPAMLVGLGWLLYRSRWRSMLGSPDA